MKRERVSVVRCNSYNQKEVDKAIEKSLKLINFDFSKYKGKRVLIKPNVVGAFPKKQIATTTNPALIEAVCKILKKNKCRIFIGDSPFTNPEASFKASGIDKIAKKYGKLVIFEQDKIVNVKNKKGKILKEFEIAKTLRDADLVINIPKLKTHSLTKFTGAIKNLYGVILGGMKQKYHNKARGEKQFSKLLIDIYQNFNPQLSIMDGVIGMEGEGPTSGDAVNSKVILASRNEVALDIACCKMIGINPKSVGHIKEAIKRKLYPDFNVEVLGKLPKFSFKIPSTHLIAKTKKILKKIFKEKPIVCDAEKCLRCGLCMKHCPTHSITMKPYPIVNKKTCIRCFCCIEICPQDAMMIEK